MERELVDDLGEPINCISMSNDGNCLLARCLDSTLRLLDRKVNFYKNTKDTLARWLLLGLEIFSLENLRLYHAMAPVPSENISDIRYVRATKHALRVNQHLLIWSKLTTFQFH